MKRTITMIVEFHQKQIAISAYEKLSTNFVQLFKLASELRFASVLIETACLKVKSLGQATINDVFAIIDSSLEPNPKIKLVDIRVPIKNGQVRAHDIARAHRQAREESQIASHKITLVHPLRFAIVDNSQKDNQKATIPAGGKNLLGKFAITLVSNQTYDFINETLLASNLKTTQIFVSKQALSSMFLSKEAMQKGAVLIVFKASETFVTINKGGTTVAFLAIQDGSLANLYQQIASRFTCSYLDAKSIFLTYGSLKSPEVQEIIYTRHNEAEEMHFTNANLYQIISAHLQKIIKIIAKYTLQNQIKHLPFIVAGPITKLNNADAFMKDNLTKNLVLYSPIQYLAVNPSNAISLGALRKHKMRNNVYNYDMPKATLGANGLAQIVQDSKIKHPLFNKLIGKLGAKYERSN